MPSQKSTRTGEKFDRLVEIMARLRSPEGCPWDREQTFDTLKAYLLEETYEVLDAIDRRDWEALADELGDLLLQPVFLAQMAAEQGRFHISDAVEAITQKLIRRHPHVFGDAEARTAEEVKHRWDQIKSDEIRKKGGRAPTLLDSVSRTQPALAEAQQVSAKAARVGFDWPDVAQVFEKLAEEVEELHQARATSEDHRIASELGDLLFVVVNLARFFKVDAEQALRGANERFRRRFAHVEKSLAERGTPLGQATLAEMEEMWQQAKRSE